MREAQVQAALKRQQIGTLMGGYSSGKRLGGSRVGKDIRTLVAEAAERRCADDVWCRDVAAGIDVADLGGDGASSSTVGACKQSSDKQSGNKQSTDKQSGGKQPDACKESGGCAVLVTSTSKGNIGASANHSANHSDHSAESAGGGGKEIRISSGSQESKKKGVDRCGGMGGSGSENGGVMRQQGGESRRGEERGGGGAAQSAMIDLTMDEEKNIEDADDDDDCVIVVASSSSNIGGAGGKRQRGRGEVNAEVEGGRGRCLEGGRGGGMARASELKGSGEVFKAVCPRCSHVNLMPLAAQFEETPLCSSCGALL